MLRRNHCLDKATIEQTVHNLADMSLAHINALLERTLNSTTALELELLLDVIKQQKKLVETYLKARGFFVICLLCLQRLQQVAHLSQTDCAAGWVSFDKKWKTIFCRQYRSIFNHCEVIGLQSYRIR